MHVPVVGYADFESILKPIPAVNESTEKYQKHILCGWCFHLVSPHGEWERVLKRAANETEAKDLPVQFVRSLIEKVKKIHLGFKKNKMVMTKKDWNDFQEADFCWLCRKGFEKEGEKIKVRDHCHYTGKFRGAAHRDCNRKFQKPNFTPVFFHNLAGYDSHLFVRSLGIEDGVLDVQCIPNSEEKYISFSIEFELERFKVQNELGEMMDKVVKHEIRFVYSFKFMASFLERLVANLPKEDLQQTARFFR